MVEKPYIVPVIERQPSHEKCAPGTAGFTDMGGSGCWCGQTVGHKHTRCPRCGGMDGSHGLIHRRYGNGGGGNVRCPNADSDPKAGEQGD